MKMQISETEIEFHLSSFGDLHGRLFWWQGQLLRGITAEHANFYRSILDRSFVKEMTRDGLLIETEFTGLSTESYPLILRHRSLPFVSYAYEWCFQTLKDAAILVLDIQARLMREGLTLHDAHPWNVVFDGCRPVYVDFCSIKASDGSGVWGAFDEFCRFFLNPLKLMAQGQAKIGRLTFYDFSGQISNGDICGLVESPFAILKRRVSWLLLDSAMGSLLRPCLDTSRSLLRRHWRSLPAAPNLMRSARAEIQAIESPNTNTMWSEYYDTFPDFSPSAAWDRKHHSVHQALAQFAPRSVLDVACNRGWYTQLAASLGSRVVSFDTDEVCINRLCIEGKKNNLQIHPLVMDLLNPSPGLGLNGQELPPAVQRLKCEIVLALALVHHLVFKKRLKFDYIVASLDAFTERCLIVEFIPKEDRYVSEWWTKEYQWYTVENFENALRGRFKKVERLPSFPDPRVLLVCEK
jgi:hypothetical protein